MVAFVNPREVVLDNATVRVLSLDDVALILTADADIFSVDASDTPVFASIVFKAQVLGWEGPLTWACAGGTLSNITADSATLNYSTLTGSSATVIVQLKDGETVIESATRRVSVIRQGVGAKLVELSPSEQVFKISKTNEVTPGSITLLARGQNTSGTPSFTVPTGDVTLAPGASNFEKVLTYANMRSESAVIKVTLDGQEDTVTIVKLREGVDGQNAVNAVLTNESVTLPAGSTGTVSSYSGAVCAMQVYEGITDTTAAWSFTFSPLSNATLTYTTSGSSATVTQLATGTDSAFIDITASRNGYAPITKRFSISKSKAGVKGQDGTGADGARGAGWYKTYGDAWSDTVANDATPGANVVSDRVTISNGVKSYTKDWDGDSWEFTGTFLSGDLFVEQSIQGSKLIAGSIELFHPDGRPILTLGGLQPQFAAPGTKNSEQQWNDIASRPLDVSSLVRKSDFSDGGVGTWQAVGVELVGGSGAASVPYTKQIITRTRDCLEGGNYFSVTPKEKIYFGVWLNTEATAYDGGFGMFVLRSDGSVAQYCMPCVLPAGRGWTYLEGSIDVAENTGAINAIPWLWQSGYDFAPAYYLRAAGMWIGRHARGATVGAPAGTMVGNTLAQDVESLAGAQTKADAAANWAVGAAMTYADAKVGGFNTALNAKLSADGNQILRGPIALQDGGAIVIGTVDNGTIISATGVAVRYQGQTLMTLPITGGPTFGGTLTAPSGNLGSVHLPAGGSIHGGACTTMQQWVDANSDCFFLDATVFASGNYAAGRYIIIYSDGRFYMPGFRYENNKLTLDSPVINSPQYAAFSISAGASIYNYSGSKVATFSRTASVTGSANLKSVQWSLEDTGSSGSLYISAGATTLTVTIKSTVPVQGQGYSNAGTLTVTAVGLDGRTDISTVDMTFDHA